MSFRDEDSFQPNKKRKLQNGNPDERRNLPLIKSEFEDEIPPLIKSEFKTESLTLSSRDDSPSGGSVWGGWSAGMNLTTTIKTEEVPECTVKEEDRPFSTIGRGLPHFSLLDICNIQLEETNDRDLPFFELVAEPISDFVLRRYQVDLTIATANTDRNRKIMNEKDAYPQILSKSKAYIIQRIDRDETTLKFIRNAIEHFNRESVSSPDSHDIIYRDNQNPTLFCNLGSATREEPIWPVTIQVLGKPIIMEGHTQNGRNVCDLSKPAILFGLKNFDEKNDNIPVNRFELKKLLKIRRGATIDKGQEDSFVLKPGLRLNQWTVDVFIKFPLRSLALDNVLICPEDSTLGAHILFKEGKYVGCEVSIDEEVYIHQRGGRTMKSVNSRSKNTFVHACRIGVQRGVLVKQLDMIEHGWHRLTVTSDGNRQLFFLDGLNIGATPVTLNQPIEMIGNRKPFNYGIGAISGFVIYRYKLTAEEIAQLCGIDFQSDVFPDTGNDRTWKSLRG